MKVIKQETEKDIILMPQEKHIEFASSLDNKIYQVINLERTKLQELISYLKELEKNDRSE